MVPWRSTREEVLGLETHKMGQDPVRLQALIEKHIERYK